MTTTDSLLKYFPLSISAHNGQPFRLRGEGTHFEIIFNHKRHLPVADPHYRDMLIGLGALLETLKVGLGQEKLALSHLKMNLPLDFGIPADSSLVSFEVAPAQTNPDPLSFQLEKRFSFRGKFNEIVSTPEMIPLTENRKLKFLNTLEEKKKVGKIFDRINARFLMSQGYIDELYSWMRFSKSDPNYYKDGLNIESMGLGKIDALGASLVLRPSVFRVLTHLRLIPLLISETSIIESSSAIVAIIGKEGDPVKIGEGFMHGWLKLTSMHLYGAPLSLLMDEPESLNEMRQLFKVAPDEVIYNILRVGPLPKGYEIPTRARLSKQELYG
jgi:hypothetical protein